MGSKRQEVTESRTVHYCDVCFRDIEPNRCYFGVSKCDVCGRDMCEQCNATETQEEADGTKHTFEIRYCKPCWEFGAPVERRKELILEEAHKRCAELDAEWMAKAKEAVHGVVGTRP